ncbi:hypothetical protein [Algibacter sp. 2305UL17-15]|uniref:hypothetical protein n=1 Tax=Algibacter sp. 2305UL17-15 TaxID=3231268 RepID=UPI003458939F
MKKSLFLALILFAITISCKDSNKKSEVISEDTKEEKLSIIGVWERTSFYNYDSDGKVVDSFASTDGNRHIKTFSPSKVMWCRNIAADSTEWFGYGSYTLTDSLLTEVLEYGSVEMSKYISQNPEFVFKYDLTNDKYSQIQIDSEGHPLFAENYIRIE